MYAITRRLSHSPAPALVALFLCALLPALQKSSFPGTLAPSVFEPLSAAAVCLAYVRLIAQPTARNVAPLVLALVASALTTETFVFIASVVSVSLMRAVFSRRVDKFCRDERLAQVTCAIDVLAAAGAALRPPARGI